MNEEVETILFISLSCVGDAVMATSVLESLHQRYPAARIDIVSDFRSNNIYTHCPYRGAVFIKDKKRFLRGSVDLLIEVRKTAYDLIVDLRTDGLAFLCRGKKRLTKLNKRSYGNHAVEDMMGVIREIHEDKAIPAPKLWLTEEEYAFADVALSPLPGKCWLALAPGNANEKKVWPAENYARLANALSGIITGVILDGSPAEKEATSAVSSRLELPFVDLAGQTNLLQAAAILSRSSLFVGGDTGLGHVAAAVLTPTLTFFSVDKPARVLPWGGKGIWLASPDEYARNIPLEDVVEKGEAFFNANR